MDKAASAPCAPGPFTSESTAFRGSRVSAGSSTYAEQDGGEEEAGKRAPFKPQSIFANVRGLPILAEGIPTFDISGRHQCCIESLEDHGNHGKESAQIAGKSRAQGQEPGEESARSEEERNQHKSEHEPRHVIVEGVVMNKVRGNMHFGVEVAV